MVTFDFNDGNGPVPAHQHPNGGGWVADTAKVDDTAYVGPDVCVYGHARVFGDACVSGSARVYGRAWVSGSARVYGAAHVFGDARVYGDAWVSGYARIYGWARVYDRACVSGAAYIFDRARVSGGAWVSGSAEVFGRARVCGSARVYLDAKVSGDDAIAFGRTGGYDWTAYRLADGSIHLQYGCESHPLDWWESEDLPALSVKHGHEPEHSRFVMVAVSAAAAIAG